MEKEISKEAVQINGNQGGEKFYPDLLPSSIGRHQTVQAPKLDPIKAIDDVTLNLMSSLASINNSEEFNSRNYTPLSVSTTMTATGVCGPSWSSTVRTDTPPRPPLPLDTNSPMPPGPPSNFIMQQSPTSTCTLSSWSTQQHMDTRDAFQPPFIRTGNLLISYKDWLISFINISLSVTRLIYNL